MCVSSLLCELVVVRVPFVLLVCIGSYIAQFLSLNVCFMFVLFVCVVLRLFLGLCSFLLLLGRALHCVLCC